MASVPVHEDSEEEELSVRDMVHKVDFRAVLGWRLVFAGYPFVFLRGVQSINS